MAYDWIYNSFLSFALCLLLAALSVSDFFYFFLQLFPFFVHGTMAQVKWLQKMQCDDNIVWLLAVTKIEKWKLLRPKKATATKFSTYDEKATSCSRITVTSFDMGYFLCFEPNNRTLRHYNIRVKRLCLASFFFLCVSSWWRTCSVRWALCAVAVMHFNYRFVMLIDRIVVCLRRIQAQRMDSLRNNGQHPKRTIQFYTCSGKLLVTNRKSIWLCWYAILDIIRLHFECIYPNTLLLSVCAECGFMFSHTHTPLKENKK